MVVGGSDGAEPTEMGPQPGGKPLAGGGQYVVVRRGAEAGEPAPWGGANAARGVSVWCKLIRAGGVRVRALGGGGGVNGSSAGGCFH